MNDKVTGIVLKQNEYRENDALLSILTKEYGVITLVARGVKKMTSKSMTSCMPYVVSEFCFDYIDGKNMFTLKNGSLQQSNRQLQQNLDKMNIASVLCDLVEKTCPSGVQDEQLFNELYDLLEFCLNRLNEESCNELILALFLAQLLKISGIPPVVDECVYCGDSKVSSISVDDGGFICSSCMMESGISQKHQVDLKRFRYINKASCEHLDILKNYGPWSYLDCDILLEFLKVHTGLESNSWVFLKKVMGL